MEKKDQRIWKRVFGKVKGGLGETDFETKTIKVDKPKHKKRWVGIPKQDNTILNTAVHENLHAAHPKMTEKRVRKVARQKVNKMSRKQKLKVYNQFN